MTDPKYIGRFAPSPTGPLHFGSLVAALGSYLDARAHDGTWLVRMEDLDPPREEPGAADRILASLEAHGLQGDGPVMYQSQRLDIYEDVLDKLQARGLVYHCQCTRAQIRAAGGHDDRGCRTQGAEPEGAARRLVQAGREYRFDDIWHGHQVQSIREDSILKRRDGLHAYQLAVVVDDIAQGVTHIVRGADLLETTATQMDLFRQLGHSEPHYGHLPLAMNREGQKLSKQNHAPALDDGQPTHNLCRALEFLGQQPPASLATATPNEVLAWAIPNWQRDTVNAHNREAPGTIAGTQ